MFTRLVATLAVLGAVCQDQPAGKPSLNDLSLEVTVLHAVHQLQLTPEQMRRLQTVGRETAREAAGARETAKASEAFRKALNRLHAALIRPRDDDQIDQLVEELNELRDKEQPLLDDGIEITDEARRQTPAVLKMFTAPQVLAFLASLSAEVADPVEMVLEAMTEARGLKEAEWRELRQSVGPQVGLLLAGLDAERAARISDRVVQLLIRARALNDEEFKKQRQELEEDTRKLAGDVGPTEVLRHVVEHAIAELLSNPRLVSALAARLK